MKKTWRHITGVEEYDDIHEHIICDFVRDERLPKEKIFQLNEDGTVQWILKGRIMGPQPLEYLLCERKLYGVFYCNILEWRSTRGFVELGIDPQSKDWHNLIKRLSIYGIDTSKVIAGDISTLDASISEFVALNHSKVVSDWYGWEEGSEEMNAHNYFIKALNLNVIHLACNILYETCGNPSGKFMTTVSNCIVTATGLAYTAAKVHLEKGFSKEEALEKADKVFLNCSTFGDDHLYCVNEKDPDFDMHDVERFLKPFGLKYTGTVKTAPLPRWYDWSEATYLSRRFVLDTDNYYKGPLKEGILEEMVMWGPSKFSEVDRLMTVLESALRECFQFGGKHFTEKRKEWNQFF